MKLNDMLNNGTVPQIGFGPGIFYHKSNDNQNLAGLSLLLLKVRRRIWSKSELQHEQDNYINSIVNAFKIGYRLLDYSSSYGDGSLIGEAVRRSRVKRSDLFITTRITNQAQMTHTIREEFMRFLEKSKLEYVDILQFHWPVTNLFLDTWREMENLYEEGYVKHLGVANCHQHHLEEIFKICKYRPEIGQFEIHPLFTQKALIEYYKSQDILVEAYTPIARNDDRLVKLPLLKRLETKYNKNLVQIILRWHIQNGIIPLVRSLTPAHQLCNFQIFDFQLDDDDMKAIDSININSRLRYDPDNCDFSIL